MVQRGASERAFLRASLGLFTRWLDKGVEAYKIRLRAEADREFERLRAELSERHIVFARLHERRAEIIADVYAKLEDLHAALHQRHGLGPTGDKLPPGIEKGDRPRRRTA